MSPAFLPERFATSFNISGEPECWMSRFSYMMYTSAMGSGGVFVIVIFGLISRYIPDKWISLPQREYWLASERRAETMGYIFRQMIWFACLPTCFFIALHFSTIHANKLNPIHLPQSEFFTLLGSFLAGTLIWSVLFLLHFRRSN
jgi:uncharacterized membrane protein